MDKQDMAKSAHDRETDQFVLNEVAKAAELYEAYMRLTAVTATLPEESTTTAAPVYDWNHPLGLVIS